MATSIHEVVTIGAATSTRPGIVETEFAPTTTPAVVLNARTYSRRILTADVVIGAGSNAGILAGPVMNVGETWHAKLTVLISRANADLTGCNARTSLTVGGVTLIRQWAWGPATGPGVPLISQAQASGATFNGPFCAFNINGIVYPIFLELIVENITAPGNQIISLIQEAGGVNPMLIKAGSVGEFTRVS